MYRRVLAFRPEAASLHYRLGLVLATANRPSDAAREFGAEQSPPWQALGRLMAAEVLGQHAEADRQLALVTANPDGGYFQLAQFYARRHDRERALAWLDRSARAHDPGFFTYTKCDPMLADLHSDPRYQALLASLRLPP